MSTPNSVIITRPVTRTISMSTGARGAKGDKGDPSGLADLGTAGYTSGHMLRIKSGGGIDGRTTAQVLSDIGAQAALTNYSTITGLTGFPGTSTGGLGASDSGKMAVFGSTGSLTISTGILVNSTILGNTFVGAFTPRYIAGTQTAGANAGATWTISAPEFSSPSDSFVYNLPSKSGTFAMTSDIPSDVVKTSPQTLTGEEKAAARGNIGVKSPLLNLNGDLAGTKSSVALNGSAWGLEAGSRRTFLAIGDSLGDEVQSALMRAGAYDMNVSGVGYDCLTYTLAGGATSGFHVNNYAVVPHGKLITMPNGSSAICEFTEITGGRKPRLAQSVVIKAVNRAGGGTLSIQKNTGSGYTEIATLATDGTPGTIASATAAIQTSGFNQHGKVKVVATGAVDFVGALYLPSHLSAGFVMARFATDGATIQNFSQCGVANLTALFSDLFTTDSPLTILNHFREGSSTCTETAVTTFLDLIKSATGNSEMLNFLMHQSAVDDDEPALTNPWWINAAETRKWLCNYDVDQATGGFARRTELGWNTDPIHLNNTAWAVVANDLRIQLIQSPTLPLMLTNRNGGFEWRAGGHASPSGAINYVFPTDAAYAGSFQIFQWTDPTNFGNRYFAFTHQTSNDANNPNGSALVTTANGSYLLSQTYDNIGRIYSGPFGSGNIFPSASTLLARHYVSESTATVSALVTETTNASHTAAIQRWRSASGAANAMEDCAVMKAGGRLELKNVVLNLGPFADDAAAATGGVPVNGVYRKTGGTIAWRQA